MSLTVEKDDHVRGPENAPVTILVYGDYECPYTRALELVILQLRRRDSDSFRYVYRYFPLREIHPHAQMAAEAAEVVSALGGPKAFWAMHDSLFADQYHLEARDPPRVSNGMWRAAPRMASKGRRRFSSMASGITAGGMRAACARSSRA